ncbi:MAG TPA: two-component regulator propeller domain-containing protein [Prolixibacteraceae bacterium]|nr:two-component regulator propeller domain-containing protein [Prolixibacteraceae bacterium]
MRPYLSLFLLTLILLFGMNCRVDGQTITFNKVLPPSGKTFKHITGIVQDVNGTMWFSSKNGIFRFDGYQMVNYKNNPLDPNSLASNQMDAICTDSTGAIWVATLDAGLDKLDPSSGIFKHYRHDPKDPGSLHSDYTCALLVDHEGILWVATNEGLDRFDPQNEQFTHFTHIPGDSTTISSNDVRAIYEDKQGTLWIGTGSAYPADGGSPEEGGLNRFDRKTGTFTRYLHDPKNPNSIINNKVRAIFEDSKGNFWVGTSGDGLHTMNRSTGIFVRHQYDPAHPQKLSRPPIDKEFSETDHITFINEDPTGFIWIGTSEVGVSCYNPRTGVTTHYESEINGSAWMAYSSREDIFWLSTIFGELYRIDPWRIQIPFEDSSSGPVNTFYEEPNGNLWIGTGQGLYITDNGKDITNRYPQHLQNYSLVKDCVTIIKEDRKGNVWIGTNKGLSFWNKNNGKVVNYKHDPKNTNSLGKGYINTLFVDKQDNLWIGSIRELNHFNPTTGNFTRYLINPKDTTLFGTNFITSIYENNNGKLWIGGLYEGLNQYDPESNRFKKYLNNITILFIFKDSDGMLWVGSDIGLYKYDSAREIFAPDTEFNTNTGIQYLHSIVEDNDKYLWLTSWDRIVRINPQRTEFIIFGQREGIFDNEFMANASYKGLDGKIYFGCANGYYAFYPTDFPKNIQPPEIIFNGFRLGDQIVEAGHIVLKDNISKIKEIRLRYHQNIFSFDLAVVDYSTVDYSHPEGNRLFFMLENYDKNWIPASSERRAYYFNVPPGNYVFHVKAINSYGARAEKQINVILLPPWWRTWWAYALYGILIITAVFGFDHFQRRRIVLIERQRTQKRELAQAKEIEKAYTELKATQTQLIQSEKMASLGELTAGIAHEIQNPLNFVNNFSEVSNELIDEMNEELNKGDINEAKVIASDLKQNLDKILLHGKRADGIVKGMLLHSRSSSGVKEPTDINKLADEFLRLAYHGLRAKDKSFNTTLKTDFDERIGTINIVPQDIGRVILNLINNAFYAVTEKKNQQLDGYEPIVSVSTKKMDDKVLISVKDNGKGISQKVLDKIFQPFFTTKPTGQGTGLGLSMSYDIVKAHGGELKVETREGEGAEFTIHLPV